ncbi:spr1629 family repressor/antitoxin [Paenibacillus shenyangensis]|uniref:spr1629 family repressor/antitoxin n=1 Tax=Paenibacillus sp. A9 TaxID=1284352 RepID=UPI000372A0A6|nr:XRE family transcriptional regulator [Paenibacillus sp. A9]
MFIGSNLTNLRIMHGYSRKQLAEMLGVTEQAVWQYENEYTAPKLQTINELKRIFHVKNKYFYHQDKLATGTKSANINITNIAYRSKILNTIYKTQAEAKHVEYLDAFIDDITSGVRIPSLQIIHLRDEVIAYLNASQDDRTTQIYRVAELARTSLGMAKDHNKDLIFLIEKSGVFIFEKAIGEKIDAYSLWTQNNRPYIILGNLKRSSVRRHFDIAHELGHLLLHYRMEFTHMDRKEHKTIEEEANLFAGAFLLPEAEFISDMKNVKRPTQPDSYIDLKKKWTTSIQALGYRAAHLGIIDTRERRNFYAALHRKSYLQIEPLDEVLPVPKPTRIKTIIDLIATKGMLDLRQMIEHEWNVDIEFFYKMTGIELSFFQKYMTDKANSNLYNVTSMEDRLVTAKQ